MKGKVIILNGASSAGKTTTAKMIQSLSAQPYLLCALDAFWDMTPPHIPAGSKNFPHLKLALVKSVKALAETGHNVVVDIVFCGQKTYQEFNNELSELETLMVKVTCPIDKLKQREVDRGDRRIGLAESQLHNVHQGVIYHLEINTDKSSPEQCAHKIFNMLS